MFERFTDRSRRAIVRAEEEARGLGHPFIGADHLLLGLTEGEGIAAVAMGQVGMTQESVRRAVIERGTSTENAKKTAKVPFSPQAKKCLEMSLREALRLGHNYIGTEHILLGVMRATEDDGSSLLDALAVDQDDLRDRVVELLRRLGSEKTALSPALSQAMDRARRAAGKGPTTTGELLMAILSDPKSQASKGLDLLGVTIESLELQLSAVPVEDTSDALPRSSSIEIRVGDTKIIIEDAGLAGLLETRGPDEIRLALERAFGGKPKGRASGS